MINILLNGCNGKMGKEVIKQISNFPNMSISCGFDICDEGLNTFPVYTKIENIESPVNIIIDFSVPNSTLNILEFAIGFPIGIILYLFRFS